MLHDVQWLTVGHSSCGGVTTARVNVGRCKLPPLHFTVEVRRTLAAVLDHSVKPRACSASGPSKPCYPQHASLYVRDLQRPVLVPTTFFKTGWGYRCLTDGKLGSAFDLPLGLTPGSPAHLWWREHVLGARFVPIKIPSAVLSSALPHLEPVYVHHSDRAGEKREGPPPHSPPSPKRPRPSPPVAAATRDGKLGTWFAALQAFLPHSAWLDDSLIAAKATKADDAEAPYSLWDGRIRGLFPWMTDGALAGFRALGLRWWRRSLYRSFIGYLCSRFGSNWLSLLPQARQHRGGGGGGGGRFFFSLGGLCCGPLRAFSASGGLLVGLGSRLIPYLLAVEWPPATTGGLVRHTHSCDRSIASQQSPATSTRGGLAPTGSGQTGQSSFAGILRH